MKSIRFSALKPGMKIVKNVFADNGTLVLKKNTYVTDFVLDLLENHDIQRVTIADEEDMEPVPEPVESASDNSDSGDSHFVLAPNGLLTENKLMQTQEFKDFKNNFLVVSDALDSMLHNIVDQNAEAQNAEQLITDGLNFYRQHVNSTGLLDKLQIMRNLSDSTFLHSMNVGMIASLIGRWLGWSEKDIELLVACGIFHDIGKLKIPDYILHKPGKLTKAEFAIMRAHTTEGYNMLKDLPIDEHIKQAALCHHRKCDGSGYPNTVDVSELDRFSKVITIADVYEAMTANQDYRQAICPFKVVEMFEQDSAMYEPEYLLTFLRHVADTYIHSHIALSNGSIAEVVMINPNTLSRPLVFTNDGEFLDLSKRHDISILHLVE